MLSQGFSRFSRPTCVLLALFLMATMVLTASSHNGQEACAQWELSNGPVCANHQKAAELIFEGECNQDDEEDNEGRANLDDDDEDQDDEDDDDDLEDGEILLDELDESKLRAILNAEGLSTNGDESELRNRLITYVEAKAAAGDELEDDEDESDGMSYGIAQQHVAGDKGQEVISADGNADLTKWTDHALEEALAALLKDGLSIKSVLNPRILSNSEFLADARRRLRKDELVVLHDAFHPVFAEAVHRELRSDDLMPWTLEEAQLETGFAYQHHNVYNASAWPKYVQMTDRMFNSNATKRWMGELTGRDCSGDVIGAPSLYKSGDFSLPHSDWSAQRTAAFVWHLTRDWKAAWGGALYWIPGNLAHISNAQHAASYNTLVLFGVTTKSTHFVTPVSRHARGKRLAFNGWFQSSWEPRDDERLDEILADQERSKLMTQTQLRAVERLVNSDEIADEERRKRLLAQFVQTLDAIK